MAVEVDTLCNATCGEVTPERTNSRNGYRSRQLDTREGLADMSIPNVARGRLLPGLAARTPPARYER